MPVKGFPLTEGSFGEMIAASGGATSPNPTSMSNEFPQQDSRVYWANIEFTYEAGSAQHGLFEGGVVYAFVRAYDVRDALDKMEEEFEDRNLGVRAVDYVTEYNEVPWENGDDQLHFDGVAALAGSTGEVFLDSFEVYERR